jgi:hypothetical protein
MSRKNTAIAHKKENSAMAELIQSAQAYEPRFLAMMLAVVEPVNCARFAIPLQG